MVERPDSMDTTTTRTEQPHAAGSQEERNANSATPVIVHQAGSNSDDVSVPQEAAATAAAVVSQSAPAVLVDEEEAAPPEDPTTVIAVVLQTYPDGENAVNVIDDDGNNNGNNTSNNNILQTYPDGENAVNVIDDDGNNNGNNTSNNNISTTSASERLGGGAQSVLRRHSMWARAFIAVAIAVVVVVTIAVVFADSDASTGIREVAPTAAPLATASPHRDVAAVPFKLKASDGAAEDKFGWSVAIDEDTVAIGTTGDDDRGAKSGSVYVYTRSGTLWTEQAKLTASDGATGDRFGWSAAMDEDTLVIGAYYDDTENADSSGSAYVYTRSGSVWTEQVKLTASDGAAEDRFGFSVAVEGNTIVIGAFNSTTENGSGSGSAHVYTRSGTVWTEQVKLTASDGAAYDNFGYTVAVNGETIVIGAPTNSGTNSSVYVYTVVRNLWGEQAKLTASDGAEENWFGHSVATDGNTIVVGAPIGAKETGLQSGSVFVYTRSGTVWTEQAMLTASDGARHDQFGFSVAIDGDAIIIGANRGSTEYAKHSGSAYVYTLSGTVWTEQAKLQTGDGLAGDRFGSSVAIDGDTIVIGADSGNREDGGNGSAYVFARSGIISIRLEACMYLIYTAAYVVLF